jgi:hypothetical protein
MGIALQPGLGVGGAEDRDPGDRGEDRLAGLEEDAEDERSGRDVGDGVPELGEPPRKVDPERLDDQPEQRKTADPERDPPDPPEERRILRLRHGRAGEGRTGHARSSVTWPCA